MKVYITKDLVCEIIDQFHSGYLRNMLNEVTMLRLEIEKKAFLMDNSCVSIFGSRRNV